MLVIGGFAMTALGEVKTVEVFDPATSQLAASCDLGTARDGCSVAQLQDGRILVTGGFSGVTKDVSGLDGQALGSTEIYSAP